MMPADTADRDVTLPSKGTPNMGRQIRKGLGSMAVKLAITKATGFAVKLVLARLLVPEMFGLVAMVTVVLGFLKIFADLGLKKALIQRRRDSVSTLRYDSAFWFLAVAGLIMAALVWLAGVPFMIWFYDEPRLAPIAMAMAFSMWLSTLGTVPRVRLTRLMKFRQIVRADVIAMLVGAASAIALALAGAGLWALVGQSMINGAVSLVLIWAATRWRPRRRFDLQSLRDVVGFSGYMLANSVLYYLRKNMDVIIVGKLLGASALGVYGLAFALTETLRMQLYSVVNKVMFPAYSRMQDDPAAMKPYYLATIRWMALITWPVSTLLILFADPLVPVLFGEAWTEAVRPVQILSVASMVFALSGTPAEVLKGLGKAGLLFWISAIHTILIALPSVIVGAWFFGLEGAAWGVLAQYSIARVMFHISMRVHLGLSELEVIKSVMPALLSSAGLMAIFAIST